MSHFSKAMRHFSNSYRVVTSSPNDVQVRPFRQPIHGGTAWHRLLFVLLLATTFEFHASEVLPETRYFEEPGNDGELVFPSDTNIACRQDAADDLLNIFACTKREWLRVSDSLRDHFAKLRTRLTSVQMSMAHDFRTLPRELPTCIWAEQDILESRAEVAHQLINERIARSTFVHDTVSGLFFYQDRGFEWRDFDRTEDVIRESLTIAKELAKAVSDLEQAGARVSAFRKSLSGPFLTTAVKTSWTHRQEFKPLKERGVPLRFQRFGDEWSPTEVRNKDVMAYEVLVAVTASKPVPARVRVELSVTNNSNETRSRNEYLDIIPTRLGGSISRFFFPKSWDRRNRFRDLQFMRVAFRSMLPIYGDLNDLTLAISLSRNDALETERRPEKVMGLNRVGVRLSYFTLAGKTDFMEERPCHLPALTNSGLKM